MFVWCSNLTLFGEGQHDVTASVMPPSIGICLVGLCFPKSSGCVKILVPSVVFLILLYICRVLFVGLCFHNIVIHLVRPCFPKVIRLWSPKTVRYFVLMLVDS